MRFLSFRGPKSNASGTGRRERVVLTVLAGAAIAGALALLSFAQTQTPPQMNLSRSIILPEANRPPDANAQMQMREQKRRQQNFDAANAERLRQMTEASDMLETLAIALKAEVDKTDSTQLSESAVRKAENIEKLARLVKEKMQLTMAPK